MADLGALFTQGSSIGSGMARFAQSSQQSQRQFDATLQQKEAEQRAAQQDKTRADANKAIMDLGAQLAAVRTNQGDAGVQKNAMLLQRIVPILAFGAGRDPKDVMSQLQLMAQGGATAEETGANKATETTAQIPAEAAKAAAVASATPTTTERDLVAAGLKPGTTEFRRAMMEAVTKPGVTVNVGSSPVGKLVNDRAALKAQGLPDDAPAIQAIDRQIAETGKPSGEQLRVEEMVQSGGETLVDLKNVLLPKGKLDPDAINAMYLNLPGSDGRTANSQMKEVASMILRIETGAQANASEIENTADRYMPKPWDNEATARDKIKRLERRFANARSILGGGDKQLTPEQKTLLSEARTAIDAGAPKDKVLQRLKERGITPPPDF